MELLYVWVEEYGNIKRQGFNFSPNYDINYDPDKKELKCEKKEMQQPKLFGENISNITAIVGKNGSGKSTVLECIRRIFNQKPSNKEKIKLRSNCEKIEAYRFKNDKPEYEIYFCGIFKKRMTSDGKSPLFSEPKTIFYTNQFGGLFFKDTNGFGYDYSIYKNFFGNTNLSKDIAQLSNNRINFLSELNQKNEIKIAGIKYPKEIIVEKLQYNAIGGKINNETLEELFLNSVKKTIMEDFNTSHYPKFKDFESIDDLLEEIKKRDKFSYNSFEIYDKYSVNYDNSQKNHKEYQRHCNSYYNFLTNIKKFKDDYLKKIKLNSNYSLKNNLEILKILNLYNYTYINKKNEWLNIKFDPPLSSGEEHMLSLYAQFYSELKSEKDQNYIILLDEPDIYMHPEWQRNIINSINEFFSKFLPNNKYQIILTSHSPFVASDLPRENVIMLDTYDEVVKNENGEIEQEIGNSKVVKDKADKPIKTFGANIFDLYKDSFFVNDIMGEFAKNKITKEIIEKLRTDNLTNEDFKNMEYIVNLIGDEVLSTILKNKIKDKRIIEDKRTIKDIIDNFSDEEREEALKLLNMNKRSDKND